MNLERIDLIVLSAGLVFGVLSFGACSVFEPCGDTKTVERRVLESGEYQESRHLVKDGTADVPLRHGHGEKTLVLDLDANHMEVTYVDLELRAVTEVWRVGEVTDVPGTE